MVHLIDTDVMVDISRRNADAAAYVDSLNDPAISIVTAQELIVGARDKRDLAGIDSLFRHTRSSILMQPSAGVRMICSSGTRDRTACEHLTP
jgi:predicted nucleic acid-binding protein